MSRLLDDLRPYDYDTNPNSRYDTTKNLGTWSSVSDVDKFFERYNHDNGYKSAVTPLRLGDYVTIQDGTYNSKWIIAGFDLEHNRTASDGTVYDNGYGICMVPSGVLGSTVYWGSAGNLTRGGYYASLIHTEHIPGIATKLQNVLGSHLIQRNVLLNNGVEETNWFSNSYIWTTAYATLMSVGQMTGTFASNANKYDDGEANYKLPIFNHSGFQVSVHFFTRCIAGKSGNAYNVYAANVSGNTANIRTISVSSAASSSVRPLIYIR